jgi:DNA-binding NtrC family response regulator
MPTPSSPSAPRRIPPGKAEPNPSVEVLLVAAAGNTRALFNQTFENTNWHLESAVTPAEALLRLRERPMAIVIYEDSTPADMAPREVESEPWLQLIEQTRNLAQPPKVIVASRQADDRMWAEVLHQGGYDVLPLPLEPGEVVRTVSMAWLEWRHEQESAPALRAMAAAASY